VAKRSFTKKAWTATQQSRYIVSAKDHRMLKICIDERQLWSRGIRRQKTLERTKLQHRLNEAKYMAFNVHPTTTAGSMEHVSSGSGVANMVPYDVFVVDLAEGVRHHPTGMHNVQASRYSLPFVSKHLRDRIAQSDLLHDSVPDGDKLRLICETRSRSTNLRAAANQIATPQPPCSSRSR
jgi:hypothetical protein